VRFDSEFNGMGIIENWISDHSRAIAVAVIEGDTVRKELPVPLSTGSALRIDVNSTDFRVRVNSNETEAVNSQLLLFAHVRGEIYYASMILMEDGTGETAIPKNLFPTGIVHFTLLGPGGNPVSERLAFTKNDLDRININLQLNRDSFELRDEVALSLSVAGSDNALTPAEMSLSVFDDTFARYQMYSTDIRSRLYLESELKGNIEDPGYYFSEETEADRHLDHLLLTQGWRSYNMEAVWNRNNINLFSLPEDGFRLSGTIKSGLLGRPLENATVAFSILNNDENLDIVTTGPEGTFTIPDLDVSGTQSFIIRANNEDGKDRVRIDLDDQFSHLESNVEPLVYELYSDFFNRQAYEGPDNVEVLAESLTERSQATREEADQFLEAEMVGELDEITVTAERDEIDEDEAFFRFGSTSSQRYDLDEREYLSTLPFNVVLNQIPGVNVVGRTLRIRTGSSSFSDGATAQIFVDNIPTDINYLLSLSTAEVKSIDVFRRATDLAIFGSSGSGGVISVQTRSGIQGRGPERGTLIGQLEGYQLPTEFYSPQYGLTVPRDIDQPDERITLFWEGDLSVPDTGEVVRFWTNDIPSTYRLVVQGITENGVPFSATQRFDVSE
jgi:hypothetical protein